MKNNEVVFLDFSHIYSEGTKEWVQEAKRLDLSDINGTTMYCTKEAEEEIRRRLEETGPEGIHFLDNGNYHYVTKFFVEKIKQPFSLVLFDHHSDMQQPMIHDLTSCGSWAGELLQKNQFLKQLILIGPSRQSLKKIPKERMEKLVCISMQEIEAEDMEEEIQKIRQDLPVYISIDKDVLDRYSARTNWSQGTMSVATLERMLKEVFLCQQVIGVDICGECDLSEPFGELVEDERINRTTNRLLYEFLQAQFSKQ